MKIKYSYINIIFCLWLLMLLYSCNGSAHSQSDNSNNQISLQALQYDEYAKYARAWITSATDAELVGQVLMVFVPGSHPSARAKQLLETVHPGGVILFEANIASTPQAVRTFTDFIRSSGMTGGVVPFIAVDHEGGVVYRLKNNAVRLPAPLKYANSCAGKLAATAGTIAGEELRWLGFTLNLAPVADTGAAYSVLGSRIWAREPELAGNLAGTFLFHHQSGRTACALKHFPGTGTADPHQSLSVLTGDTQLFHDSYLVSFQNALAHEPGAVLLSLVIAPVLDPDVPVVFSYKAVTGYLKEKLGYRGFVLTDDLYMKALSGYGTIPERCLKALNAGCDMLMLSVSDVEPVIMYLLKALEEKRLERARLEDAVTRIIVQKKRFSIDSLEPFSEEAYTELLEKHKAMLRAVIENSYQDGFHNNKNPGYHGIHMNRKFLYEETNIWAGSGFACSVSTVCTKFRRAVY